MIEISLSKNLQGPFLNTPNLICLFVDIYFLCEKHLLKITYLVTFQLFFSGMKPNGSFTLEPFDRFGPLSSTVVRGRDWLLWLAWVFVIACSFYGFVMSNYGQGVITRWRVLWQEHQHIE